MNSIEQRLDYLEEANDVLRMQNHVLATAFKGMIRALPADLAEDVVESVQLAFEDALAELTYEDSPHTDLFHDVTYAFFREKEH
ncbi:NGO1151 family protein [Neisseria animaloris]|uniref:NGO1151 family protein n=1 Tax=Neisseria animaloris TaxID=326522 RepID=UPI0039E00396